jgi:LysR family transcriptional regulator, benzoate and cis,cis-muconate-responsive activator of ben and cat genes
LPLRPHPAKTTIPANKLSIHLTRFKTAFTIAKIVGNGNNASLLAQCRAVITKFVELRHLQYFRAVAEELSFSRAAERLRVAQPALSRAVKQLEASIGAEVLERSRHHVRLTPAGAILLHESALLFQQLEDSIRRVRRTAAGEEGELRLGYIGPPTTPFLGRLLAEYQRRYPLVTIHLEERTPERVWEMVAKGRLAAAITRPVVGYETSGMKTTLLRAETLGVVVPAKHPFANKRRLPWTALAREPLIVLARREGMGLHDAVIAGCRRAGVLPRLAQTPSLIGTVMTYVEAGAGIGVVTELVGSANPQFRFIPLTPVQTVPLVLVWQEDQDPPPVRRFRELLSEWNNAGKLWKRDA